MLGREDVEPRSLAGITRKPYLRSVSWCDRSPTKPNPKLQPGCKGKSGLPPLSIVRRPVEEWPRASSDDLGVWPNPETPRGSLVNAPENSGADREFLFDKDKVAFFEKQCSRIADHVYLGSDAVAKNREVLRQNGITHVLNCVGFVCPEYFKGDLVYKTLWLHDRPSEDITSILYDVFDYFEDVRERGGRVLVHCFQGVSRSASLVIAYLMWGEGQSFEDAFQNVKAVRDVANPNMGFACQLLQCQKRVHAMPPSPNSMLRMYRMVPHSSYDPLHLVPKLLSNPGTKWLDSRSAFIMCVPSAIYVWIGKYCNSVMSGRAGVAANQVIRYERAKGPIVTIEEGEEPSDFWDAFSSGQFLANVCIGSQNMVGAKKVDEYDLDFKLFNKALLVAGMVVDAHEDLENNACDKDLSSPPFPCGSPDSFSDYTTRSPKFSSKSPTLSPSTSDYASSFTVSPSSSNWSDLSFSSQQPSPSALDATEPSEVAKNTVSSWSSFVPDLVDGATTMKNEEYSQLELVDSNCLLPH